jgi:hypothetical protein
MDKLDQAIAALKAENKRLVQQLNQVRAAIAALRGITNNGREMKARLSGRTMSASGRKRIAAAQKAHWAEWRAAQKKAG